MGDAIVICDSQVIGPNSSGMKKTLVLLPPHLPSLDFTAVTRYLVTAVPSPYPDKFVFEVRLVSSRSFELYTRRVDSQCGWGQNLIVQYIIRQSCTSCPLPTIYRIAFDIYRVGSNGGAPDTPHTKLCHVVLPPSAPDISSPQTSIFVSAIPSKFKDTFIFNTRRLSLLEFELNVVRTDCLHGWGQQLHVLYTVITTDAPATGASLSPDCLLDPTQPVAHGILPLYRSCTVNISVSRSFMQSSQHALLISSLLSRHRSQEGAIDVEAFLRTSYGNETPDHVVQSARRTINRFHQLLPHHDKLLFSSLLDHCVQSTDTDPVTLRMHVDMMAVGNSQCNARRKLVLYNLLSYFATASTVSSNCVQEISAIDSSITTIKSVCARAIDNLKMKVIQSLFLEPSKMFFRIVNNTIMEGDVDVHGINTILTILHDTLGVKTSQPALENDDLKGFADVLTIFGEDILWNVFCSPENLGKSWECIFNVDSRTNSKRLKIPSIDSSNVRTCTNSLFPSSSLRFRVAHDWGAYVSSTPHDELQDSVQCHVNQYLYLFSKCFTVDRVAPYLLSCLLNSDGCDLLQHLQRLYHICQSESGDVRYFVYDDDFNISIKNVVKLLSPINIFESREWE